MSDKAPLVDRVKVHKTELVPPGSSGWTFRNHIMIRHGLHPAKQARLIRHELVHVAQYQRYGTVGFLRRYIWHYLKNLWRLRDHRKAYLAIPFEIEARYKANR